MDSDTQSYTEQGGAPRLCLHRPARFSSFCAISGTPHVLLRWLLVGLTCCLLACRSDDAAVPLTVVPALPSVTPPGISPARATATTLGTNSSLLAACPPARHMQPLRQALAQQAVLDAADSCTLLTLDLDESASTFVASAEIVLRNSSNDLWSRLLFRLYPQASSLGGVIEIEQVQVEGVPVQWEYTLPDRTGLMVPLEVSLAPGASTVVFITFHAQLATAGEGMGMFAQGPATTTIASWFPRLAPWNTETRTWQASAIPDVGEPPMGEMTLVYATLSAPARFDLATSGIILSRTREGARYRYEVVSAPTRDLALVWMEGYQAHTTEVDGVLLHHWCPPEAKVATATILHTAREAMLLFNKRFGPYPFKELEIVVVPLAQPSGLEYPQLILLDEAVYQNPNEPDLLEFVVAHQMAYQWWYITVSSDRVVSPWQDEALAHWSVLLWLEETEGLGAAARYRRELERNVTMFAANAADEPLDQPLARFDGRREGYHIFVQSRGALFLYTLRTTLGDELFFEVLQEYYLNYQFRTAPAGALLDAFDQAGGSSLDALFAAWGVTP